MKYLNRQSAVTFVTPPEGTQTTGELLAAVHADGPAMPGHSWAKDHDQRPDLASKAALQRMRARLMQPRTAVDSHLRTRRRAPV